MIKCNDLNLWQFTFNLMWITIKLSEELKAYLKSSKMWEEGGGLRLGFNRWFVGLYQSFMFIVTDHLIIQPLSENTDLVGLLV